ncbi:hypothetical protein DBR32_10435 [Taibaiella sp. KBW10]|nr:hypothetical protein DBR32_10435 [Taibaiella sp. KBW10]
MSSCFASLAQDQTLIYASDSSEIVHAAKVYIKKQSGHYTRYEKKAGRSQRRLLKRLQRQENQLARQLQRSDSLLYARYRKLSSLSFDSLGKSLKDSTFLKQAQAKYPSKALDSLKKIQNFIQNKAGLLVPNNAVNIPGLEQLNQKLNVQSYIQNRLKQRNTDLGKLLNNTALADKAAKLKQTFGYGQQQVGYWKQIVQDPDEAEQKALDYLQGIEGFNEYLSKANGVHNMAAMNNPNISAEELQQMGFQTKASVAAGMQQQFGNQLDQLQQQAGQQVQEYSKQLGIDKHLNQVKKVNNTIKENKALVKETQNSLKEGKQNLKRTGKELKNPMRGIPFWHRWELQYNFQSQRASADGLKPVMVQTGINAAYRQTPKLSFGVGLDGSLGLGKDWQHLKLSYEGITARVYLDYKVIWGISLQGGYEKSLRPNNRPYVQLQEQYGNSSNLKTAMGLLQDAAYLGVMKSYKVNSKAQGTFLIGYNFLSDKSGINSPWMIRLGWKL